MDKNEELNKSLVVLLKMFKNRPYHLAKYLIENSALNNEFINKLTKSDKLKKTNIFPNIKILNRLLGPPNSQILRKTHEHNKYDDERLNEGEFVKLEL